MKGKWPTAGEQVEAVRAVGLKPILCDGYNNPQYEINAGYKGIETACMGVMLHDTGTSVDAKNLRNTHSLQWILTGNESSRGTKTVRACQWYIARNGDVYFVYARRTWHSGESAPIWGIPKNASNRYLLGIEIESHGGGRKDLTDAQIKSAVLLSKALLHVIGQGTDRLIQHKTIGYVQGKVDTAYSMEFWRDKVNAQMQAAPMKRNLARNPITPGETSPEVARLKARFKWKNTSENYGKPFEDRIVKWQKNHPEYGKADGVVGPKTWAALIKD